MCEGRKETDTVTDTPNVCFQRSDPHSQHDNNSGTVPEGMCPRHDYFSQKQVSQQIPIACKPVMTCPQLGS